MWSFLLRRGTSRISPSSASCHLLERKLPSFYQLRCGVQKRPEVFLLAQHDEAYTGTARTGSKMRHHLRIMHG